MKNLVPLQRLALAALTATACLNPLAAQAQDHAQVPGYYHQSIGEVRVTALFDGIVPLGRELLVGAEPAQVDALLKSRFVPETAQGVQTAVNAYLVEHAGQTILVDAGAAQCFGPGLGQIASNLQRAGYAPERVDAVLLTHAHPDHLCGLTDADGKAVFSKATVWLSQQDADVWLSEKAEAQAPEAMRSTFQVARRTLAPYQAQQRLRLFGADTPLPAGFAATATPGHTPGHTSFRLDAGAGQTLFIWGDVVHFHAVQFAQPKVAVEFDWDKPQAIASRQNVLRHAASQGWWVAGAHLPFPGIGHVAQRGEGYEWIPTEFLPAP